MAEEKKRNPKFDWRKIEPNAGALVITFDSDDSVADDDSEYGHWWLYPVIRDGVKHSWFADSELYNLFSSLGIKQGTQALISTEFYQWTDKTGKPRPDVYGILDYKGKHPFGKKGNGHKPEGDQPKPETKTEQPQTNPEQKKAGDDILCTKFSIALSHVLAEMKALYTDEQTNHVDFNSSDVERMVVSLFMALKDRRD